MPILRTYVFGVPIGSWVLLALVIYPSASDRGGCAGWGLVISFYCVASLAMVTCLGPSIFLVVRSKKPLDLLAILLNLSWILFFARS